MVCLLPRGIQTRLVACVLFSNLSFLGLDVRASSAACVRLLDAVGLQGHCERPARSSQRLQKALSSPRTPPRAGPSHTSSHDLESTSANGPFWQLLIAKRGHVRSRQMTLALGKIGTASFFIYVTTSNLNK